MSAETWRRLDGAVPGENRGTIAVKGFAESIEVYEIDPETQPDDALRRETPPHSIAASS